MAFQAVVHMAIPAKYPRKQLRLAEDLLQCLRDCDDRDGLKGFEAQQISIARNDQIRACGVRRARRPRRHRRLGREKLVVEVLARSPR